MNLRSLSETHCLGGISKCQRCRDTNFLCLAGRLQKAVTTSKLTTIPGLRKYLMTDARLEGFFFLFFFHSCSSWRDITDSLMTDCYQP